MIKRKTYSFRGGDILDIEEQRTSAAQIVENHLTDLS